MLTFGNPEIHCSIHLFNLINNRIATTLKAYYVRFETSKRIIKVLPNISDYGITIVQN